MRHLTVLALAAILASATALAEPPEGERPERRGPPPEAVEACADLVIDDVCSFEDREGELKEGSCFKPDDAPEDAPVACRPDDAPPHRDGERPPPRGQRGQQQ